MKQKDELNDILEAGADINLDELEAQLEAGDAPTPTVIASETHDEDVTAVANEIAAEEVRDAAYAATPAETVDETTTVSVAEPTTAKVARKRVSTAKMKASEALLHVVGNDPAKFALETGETGSEASRDEFLTASDGLNKKVRMKSIQMFKFGVNGGELCTFLKLGLDTLISKGTVSVAELRDAIQADGYAKSTATPQAANIAATFNHLKVASLNAGVLTVNPKSRFVEARMTSATTSV